MKQEPISLVSFQYLFMRYYNQQYSQFTHALAQEAERHFVFSFLAQTLVLWTSSSFVMKEALQNETSTDMIVEGKFIK